MNEIMRIGNHEVAVKEYRGKRVVTFKDIDLCHERAEGTARKRFNDNKVHFVKNVDFFKITPSEFRTVIGTMDIRQQNDVTLITESGYLMLVKSFTDELAWKVQRELVDCYFNQKKGLSVMEQIKTIAAGYIEMDEKIESVNNDLQEFKQDMPILGIEESRITAAVRAKGVDCLGGKESAAYQDKSLRGKVYADIYGQLKREFGVSTYKAIKRSQCDDAIHAIDGYRLPSVLQDRIEAYNGQLHLQEEADVWKAR